MIRSKMIIPIFGIISLFNIAVTMGTFPRLLDIPLNRTILIHTGEDIRLECESPQEISWQYPVVEGAQSPNFIRQPGMETQTSMIIRNASYLNTGFYSCLINGTSTEKIENDAQVYIFVTDPVNLLVPEESFVIGYEHQPLTLPCRPTSPDVSVSLTDDYDEHVSDITYHPQFGFTIPHVHQEHAMSYHCQASRGSVKQSLYFYLHILPASDSVEPPKIFLDIENGEKEVAIGSTFNLTCTVEIKHEIKFKLTWKLPDSINHKVTLVKVLNTTSMTNNGNIKATTQVQVYRAIKADLGRYVCTVQDHNNNVNSAEIDLRSPRKTTVKQNTAESAGTITQYSTAAFITCICQIFISICI